MSLPDLDYEETPSMGAQLRAGRVRALLNQPGMLGVEYQPIVDLHRREVWGYEVLARLPGNDGPSAWFEDARQEGVGARLELLVLSRSIALLPSVPSGRYLSINVSVETLAHSGLQEMLQQAGALASRLVLEVSEDLDADAVQRLVPVVDVVRQWGARIAVGDAAGGYAGLSSAGALRPDVVKLDRSVVHGMHTDDVRRSLGELIRSQAVRQGAAVFAVGVEHPEDLRLLAASGVRFVQGFLLGRPAPALTELPVDVVRLLEELVPPPLVRSIGLVRPPDDVQTVVDETPQELPVAADVASSEPDFVRVVVTPSGLPVAMVVGPDGDDARPVPVSLRVGMSWPLSDVARAAAAREPHLRYDPVLVVDDEGKLEGVICVADLLTHLAQHLDD